MGYQPQFVNYSAEHFGWLLAAAASMAFWIYLGRRVGSDRAQRQVGLAMSLIPIAVWATANIHMLNGAAPVRLDLVLPFQVCYFLNLLMPVMLWRRSYPIFEVAYFMVMAGCIQALLTPDFPQSFPNLMNIRYFFIHIGLAQSILFAIFVYDFQPTWAGLRKSLLWANAYLVFAACLNLALDTNFMYLCRKPPTATLLDLFGEWPWYILGGELLALVLFAVVMLPFQFRRKMMAPAER